MWGKKISDSDGEEDYNFEDEDEDDEDKEFMLEEKRKRKSKVPKKLSKRKRSAKRVMSSDDDFQSEKCKKKTKRRKKGSTMTRDLDFVCSGSSDLDCMVYDEKKELLREAKFFCGPLNTSFRNLSLLKTPLDQGVANCQQERRRRKGKEKLNELQDDSRKQVCGICLSEEGNRTVRGTLNSCMQTEIYQLTEEELIRLVCVECQQDGDDSVMPLCDICDSPAHTYCVGLGRNVPEGNWYCRTCYLGSLNSDIQDPVVHKLNDPSFTHRTNRDETTTSHISVSIPII
ncbi:hypothetical protein GIB67_010130 [Kingdonia uniflora]|uniref:PHD-type domain-containing protein n=1 Tax=Kingdonia uniflora TaxID=39325 RepID=A0A7J7NAW1_9MAGN|nr:hypothetical protein GIB67_010130 [Kingdonia uniflora]